LTQLTAPGKDAEDFARVLKDQEICAFDEVNILLNQPEHIVRQTIDGFFDQKKPDDLLVLYFSGHGVRDELGALYLAVKNTNRLRLRSTALKSDFVREAMDQSRSKRQILILDCCNSGAFAQGTKAATGVSIGTASSFEAGYGRVILTASDSTQFAWEGDRVIGETDNSLFTHFLVKGLEGEADIDGDGHITVDELYDYAYEQVKLATPKQSPSKFSSKQQGEIVLRQITRIQDIKPVSLSDQLISEIENPYPEVRLRAIQQLVKLLNGKNLGLARSAKEALEQIVEEDDSRQVSRAAAQALGLIHETKKPRIRKESEADRLPAEQNEEPSKLEPDEAAILPNRQALITLGWATAGAIAGVTYDALDEVMGEVMGGAVGGAIGGLITAIALKNVNPRSNRTSLLWITLAWAIGGAVGWTVGEQLTEAIGMATGFLAGSGISMAILIATRQVLFNWKSLAWTVLGWTIGAGIGWFISRRMLIDELELDYATSWGIGTAIGWSIGGFVTGWQLLKNMGTTK
jgi:hypothetical protein